MKVVKIIVRLLVLAVVTGAFFGAPYCWLSLKSQRLLWAALMTLVLGRFFCDWLCPLGILQSFVGWLRHPKSHVRRVCSRLPETRAQRIVRWSVFAVVGLGLAFGFGGASLVLPMSVYGKAVTLWTPGLVLFGLVLALSFVGQGRLWCNWICPYGTVFNLLAKVALRKDKVGAGCASCRRCLGVKDEGRRTGDESGVTRRETLKGVAVLAVAEKLTDGGFAPVSTPGASEREQPVLPPGADSQRFAEKCVGCQLCVANCPGKCLRPSLSPKRFGQPEMDFREGYCLLNCARCSEVCPEGAIFFLQREQRPHVHMGVAVWKKDLCVRTKGEECSACVRKCPVQAIHLVKGFPVVDANACIGCGACEHVCPARPLPAIFVQGYSAQRIVNPMTEKDMLEEMKSRLAAGASVVVAKDGVIAVERQGRGLDPLLALFDEGRLAGAVVVDKVIGRAAAAILAKGGARRAHAELAGEGAAELLARHGVAFSADKTVKVILNHKQTDSCPMEKAVAGLDEPEKMIEAIRKAKRK